MDKKLERRAFAQKASVRTKDDGVGLVSGHAAVFERVSLPIYDMFYEINQAGCFASALLKRETKVQAVYAHNDSTVPLAVFRGGGQDGTLLLREDEVGLYCEYEPLDSDLGRSLIKSIARGDTDGCHSRSCRCPKTGAEHIKACRCVESLKRIFLT